MDFNINDFNQDDDDFDDIDEIEAEMMADAIAQNSKNHEEQLKIANRQMNHDLMDKAIFASKGWFWGLLPQSVKLYRIAEAFETFRKLTS